MKRYILTEDELRELLYVQRKICGAYISEENSRVISKVRNASEPELPAPAKIPTEEDISNAAHAKYLSDSNRESYRVGAAAILKVLKLK